VQRIAPQGRAPHSKARHCNAWQSKSDRPLAIAALPMCFRVNTNKTSVKPMPQFKHLFTYWRNEMANTAMTIAQAKMDHLQAKWMEKLDQMRIDHPDTPEGALMRMALLAARVEIEAQAHQQKINSLFFVN
jgi:hypothetical protein